MPGDSKDADPEDRRLDMSFKTEKVEFLLVARPITDREIKEGCIVESVNESAWDIQEAEDFEDAMGKATNMLCTGNKHLIHQVYIQRHGYEAHTTTVPNANLYYPGILVLGGIPNQNRCLQHAHGQYGSDRDTSVGDQKPGLRVQLLRKLP